MTRRRFITTAAALGAATAGGAAAQAGGTVRILVGAPPGGSTDMLARAIAPDLARSLGRSVVVENRAGAGGNLAAELVAKAPPDGSTLLLTFTGHAINATLYPKLPFDPIADFTPLTMVATQPSMLVANPSVPFRTLKELIAYAKPRPGKLTMGVATGASVHLAGEAFKMQAGLFIVNVAYRGTSPAITDLIAGHVELMMAPIAGVRPHLQSGRLIALGVTSPKRLPQFPDVPAITEVLPGYTSAAWFGLLGPARMPAELTRTIADAARAAVRSDLLRQRLEPEAATPVGNSPEEFAAFLREDVPRWAKLVRWSGATPE